MVYYKLVLNDKRVREDSTYPVEIRITYLRKNTTIATGIRIKKEQWDSRTQLVRKTPNFQKLNQSIGDLYSKVQKIIHELDDRGAFSFITLREHLADKPAKSQKVAMTFNQYSDDLVKSLLSINKVGNALVYKTASNRLIGFAGGKMLRLEEIDYTFLEAFQRHLISQGVKQNSISNYLRTVRAIFNRAIKAKLIDRSLYPFTEITIKAERTPKRAISKETLKAMINTILRPGTLEYHARNFFLLSFYLRGASFTDMAYLRVENIRNGRIEYIRRKTKKSYSIKLLDQAWEIINLYTSDERQYLLPVLQDGIQENSMPAQKVIHQWIKTTNKYLKRIAGCLGIDSVLTTYVSRHTWATIAKRLGYSNEIIAEALGHEYGNKVTGIYLDDFDTEVIDEVNQTVTRL